MESDIERFKLYAHNVADIVGLEKLEVFPFIGDPIGIRVYIWWRAEMTEAECSCMVRDDF